MSDFRILLLRCKLRGLFRFPRPSPCSDSLLSKSKVCGCHRRSIPFGVDTWMESLHRWKRQRFLHQAIMQPRSKGSKAEKTQNARANFSALAAARLRIISEASSSLDKWKVGPACGTLPLLFHFGNGVLDLKTLSFIMTIAIEVPGEAAPLTPQQVYLALQSASSHQQNFIQTGTQQLQTWEGRHGYYTLLQVRH